MSYPAARYHGDKGEVNASFRTADTPPDLTSPRGDAYRYLATHESTGGEYGLYQVDLAALAAGAKSHFHKAMSEACTFRPAACTPSRT